MFPTMTAIKVPRALDVVLSQSLARSKVFVAVVADMMKIGILQVLVEGALASKPSIAAVAVSHCV